MLTVLQFPAGATVFCSVQETIIISAAPANLNAAQLSHNHSNVAVKVFLDLKQLFFGSFSFQ